MQRPPDVDEWLSRLNLGQRQQAEHLARDVGASAGGVTAAIKWQRLTFTVNDDWHHWLCAITVSRQAVSLTFHKGSLLDDPAGLLEGDGRYVRHVPYDRAAGNPDAVKDLVRQAVTRQTDMLP